MYWYFWFTKALVVLFIAVMARRLIFRGRHFLHIFQLHGYKQKEYWSWIKEKWHERIIVPAHTLYNIILLVLFIGLSDTITGTAVVIILAVYAFFWFGPLPEYVTQKQKKPIGYTPRLLRLLVPFGLLAVLLPMFCTQLYYSQTAFRIEIYVLAFGWILADILVPFLIFPAATIMKPVERWVHYRFKQQARQKLASMPDLTVIAITGSYGKTSTKFMIRDLLAERFNVCSTPASYNTPMGICKVINNDLRPDHQVLVLEMGARYEGNIDELCDIAQPDLSVVTNVGVAHLETFGSQDVIAREKSTLVRRLKSGGTAVLNTDDERVRHMADLRGDIKVIKAGLDTGNISANNISYDTEGTHAEVRFPDGSTDTVSLRLLGRHNVQNLLLAMGVGHHLGLRFKTMALAARNIEPVEHRLELKRSDGLVVIDDAFNSNPVGARNAIDVLAEFQSGRRIVITPGMIELGDRQEHENRTFGAYMARTPLDLVLLVGEQQTKPIREGLLNEGYPEEQIKVVQSLFEANSVLRNFAQEGDVVLYENDLPDTYNE